MLKLANTKDTLRITKEDDDTTWIEVRTELTRKEAMAVAKYFPTSESDRKNMEMFLDRSFAVVVTAWAVEDEDGKLLKPTIELYDKLAQTDAQWVTSTVQQHLIKVMGLDSEKAEGKLSESDETQSEESV